MTRDIKVIALTAIVVIVVVAVLVAIGLANDRRGFEHPSQAPGAIVWTSSAT